jgi:hypothetical protein
MCAFNFYKRVNMRKVVLTTILFVMGLLFSGCGIKTSEYAVSADNVEALRAIEGVKLSVDRFTTQGEEEYHVMCRAAETVTTPGGESFASYISNALKSELKMSGIYDKQSDIELSGEVVDMYASSMLGNAYWEFKVKVKSSIYYLRVLLKALLVLAYILYLYRSWDTPTHQYSYNKSQNISHNYPKLLNFCLLTIGLATF